MRSLAGLLLACICSLALGKDIAPADLPAAARETLALIDQGGPFPYPRDGIEFRNFEKRLPPGPRGHYREYTVRTPGVKHRGARRIVCGGAEPRQPETCFYSDDHYQSFRKIIRERQP